MRSASTNKQQDIRDERTNFSIKDGLRNHFHQRSNCACCAAGDSEPAFGVASGRAFVGLQCACQLLADSSTFSGASVSRDSILVLLPQKARCLCCRDGESKGAGARKIFIAQEATATCYVHRGTGRSLSAECPRYCEDKSSVKTQTTAHKKEQSKKLHVGTTPEAVPLEVQQLPTQEGPKVLPPDQDSQTFEAGPEATLPADASTARTKRSCFFFESTYLKRLRAPTAIVASEHILEESLTPLNVLVEDKAASRMIQVPDCMCVHICCSDSSCILPRPSVISRDLPDVPDCCSTACQTEPVEFFHKQRKQPAIQEPQPPSSHLGLLLPEQPLSCDPTHCQFNSPGAHRKLSARQLHAVDLMSEHQKNNGLPRRRNQQHNQPRRQHDQQIQDTQQSLGGVRQAQCAARKYAEKQRKMSRSVQNILYNESQDEPERLREATVAEEVVSSQTAETWEPVILSTFNSASGTKDSVSASVAERQAACRRVNPSSRPPETYVGESPRYNSSLPTCSSEASSGYGDSWQQSEFLTDLGVKRQRRTPKHNLRRQLQGRLGVGLLNNTNNSLMSRGPQCSSMTDSPAGFVSTDPLQSVVEVTAEANHNFTCLFRTLDRAHRQLSDSQHAVKGRKPKAIGRKSVATSVRQPGRDRFTSRSFDTCKVDGLACCEADDLDGQQAFLGNGDSEDSEVGNCLDYNISFARQQWGEDCYGCNNDRHGAAHDSRFAAAVQPPRKQPVGDTQASQSFPLDRRQRTENRCTETELLDSVADSLFGLSRKLRSCLHRIHSAAAELQERNADLI